jgi:hypothetical protein
LIAYARGEQGKNQAGEYTNPRQIRLVKKEVWIVDTRTARTTRIGEGEAPMFNRQAIRLFDRAKDLWTAP